MIENPVKPRITQSRKNLDKQDKIGFRKNIELWLAKSIANYKQYTMGKICKT